MKYKQGDVVIIRFPFSDLTGNKKRPALIISNITVNETGEYLMVQITSKSRNDNLTVSIDKTDYIDNLALPLISSIRIHKIFLLNNDLILFKKTAVNGNFLRTITKKISALIE